MLVVAVVTIAVAVGAEASTVVDGKCCDCDYDFASYGCLSWLKSCHSLNA